MNKQKPVILVMILSSALAATPLRAEGAGQTDERELWIGSHVRVLPLGQTGKRLIGNVVAVDAESIQIQQGNALEPRVVRVPTWTILKIEALRGRRRAAREGAIIGFVPMALLGGLFAFVMSDCDGCVEERHLGVIPAGAAISGAVGGLLGAAIGSAGKTDRWVEIPKARWSPRLSVAPAPRGVSLAFTLRF
jgi:hypothetical protein